MLEKLLKVQSELKAPKGQYNAFGKYKYRSAEDVLESVKPLLVKHGLLLTISDELITIGDRYYVKATVLVEDVENKESKSVSALAREEETKKGMDGSQITGAASSYARKYALNGMFAIDDNKDSDGTNKHEDKPKQDEPTETKLITPTQIKIIQSAYKKEEDMGRLLTSKNIKSLNEMPYILAVELVEMLKEIEKKKNNS